MYYEIRWKQRFQNFEKAYILLDEGVSKLAQLNQLEKEGVIQRFEIVIELAWKTLKDFLESEGHSKIRSGKQAIRQAYQDGIIKNPEVWMSALEKRNLTSHTYNERICNQIVAFVHDEFIQVVNEFYLYLKKEL